MLRQACRDAAGLDTPRMKTMRAVASLELVRRPQVGGLARSIRYPRVVGAVEVDVVEVHLGKAVRDGGEDDNARIEFRSGGFDECVFEQVDQQEVREVVSAYL